MNIYKLEEYGLAVIGNGASNYGILLPVSLERRRGDVRYIVNDFKNLTSFILKVTDKHLLAGLPISSILGTTLRRLSILLKSNPNTKNLILILNSNNSKNYFKNCTVNSAEEVINVIKEYLYMLSNKNGVNINNIINLDKIIKRARLDSYGINIDSFLDVLSRVKEITITGIEKLPEIRNKILESFDNLGKIKIKQRSFNIHPVKVSQKSALDLNDNLRSENIKELYNKIGRYLCVKGVECKDRDGLKRIQMQEKVRCVLEYRNDEENKVEEVRELLNELGVEDDITLKETIFFEQVKNYIDDYIYNIFDSIINKKLGYTNVLPFFDKQGAKSVQLGWIYTHMYSRENQNNKNGVILFNCLHELRSIDFHDGLPYNLLFCVELSEFMRDKIVELKEKFKQDLNIKLGSIELHIVSLHGYVDNFPEKR